MTLVPFYFSMAFWFFRNIRTVLISRILMALNKFCALNWRSQMLRTNPFWSVQVKSCVHYECMLPPPPPSLTHASMNDAIMLVHPLYSVQKESQPSAAIIFAQSQLIYTNTIECVIQFVYAFTYVFFLLLLFFSLRIKIW